MNIFYLDKDVIKCAEYHNDRHCVKMILEYCQLLSTAHRVLDGCQSQIVKNGRKAKVWSLEDEYRDRLFYSATHMNHPSAIWVRQSSENYLYLHKLLEALCVEYTYRYGRPHKSENDGLVDELRWTPDNIPVGKFTEPTPAMPDEIKIKGNSLKSYRNYYFRSKQHLASWKNRDVPQWLVEMSEKELEAA
jgi:hypothetical protein